MQDYLWLFSTFQNFYILYVVLSLMLLFWFLNALTIFTIRSRKLLDANDKRLSGQTFLETFYLSYIIVLFPRKQLNTITGAVGNMPKKHYLICSAISKILRDGQTNWHRTTFNLNSQIIFNSLVSRGAAERWKATWFNLLKSILIIFL